MKRQTVRKCQRTISTDKELFEIERFKFTGYKFQLQGTNGIDIFSVHGRIKAFTKKLILWKNNVQDYKYDCVR